MDILFLLVPLSVLLALVVMGVLAWAVWSGQFEELESEGQRILQYDLVSAAEINQQDLPMHKLDPYQYAP